MDIELDDLHLPTLTEAELVSLLNSRIGLNVRESKDMVETFFDVVTRELVAGETVQIMGFGIFKVRSKNPRAGRNLRTGETVEIPAKRVVTFGANGLLKERLDDVG